MTRFQLAPVSVFLTMALIGETAFQTFSTMGAVYRIVDADLNPLQLILVGTVLEASVFLFEVPTGVVADVYSRKLSMVIGFALIGAGFILEGSMPIFGTILLAQAVWGIGYTFTSGARQAWLADELGDDDRTSRTFLRAAKFEIIGSLIGMGLSVALATIFIGLSLIVGGVIFLALALFVTVVMPERGFQRTPKEERETWASMKGTLRSGLMAVRGSRILIALIVIELFYGISSEPWDRLWQKHVLDSIPFPDLGNLDPVVWFGIVAAASLLIGLVVMWWVERKVRIESPNVPRIVLSITNALVMGASLTFALTGNFGVAMGMVVAVSIFRRVADPMIASWLNRNTESAYRATVFSVHSQANAIGQAALGPGMGVLAIVSGLRAALVGVALLLVPPQIIYAVMGRLGKRE